MHRDSEDLSRARVGMRIAEWVPMNYRALPHLLLVVAMPLLIIGCQGAMPCEDCGSNTFATCATTETWALGQATVDDAGLATASCQEACSRLVPQVDQSAWPITQPPTPSLAAPPRSTAMAAPARGWSAALT